MNSKICWIIVEKSLILQAEKSFNINYRWNPYSDRHVNCKTFNC